MRIKTILIAVLVLLVVLLGGATLYVLSIDYNQYKGLIASEVERATGRKLTINGKIELALSLTPTLTAKDLSLANLPGGSRPEMIMLKRLEVQMQLLPLLSRQVKVDLLVLHGADILLETDKTGRGNWVFSHAETGSAGPAAASGEGPSLPEISLVKIRDSLVTYRDGDTGMSRSLRIDSLDAATKGGRIALDLAALIAKSPVTVKGSVGAPELLSGGAPFPFDLVVTSGSSTAKIKGAVGDIVQMQGLAADVSAQGKRLSELSDLAGITLPPLGPYSFAGKAVDIPGGYRINDLTLNMGGSSLKGELALTFAKRPKITADLAADTLDLRDFGVTPGHDGPDDGRVFSADPLPFALLNEADADLKVTAKRFVRESAVFGDVKLTLALNAGRLQVKPLSANIEGGTLVANLTADGTRTPPPVTLDLTQSNAEAGSLLAFLTGTRILNSGRAHLRINGASAGNSLHALMAGLNGSFDYDMGAGNIDNAYARIFLANLFTLVSFGSSGNSSNVKCLVGRFDIRHGVATARHLAMETKGAIIIGKGTINLGTEQLDLHLSPYATAPNLTNFAVPIMIQGSMSNPQVGPDAAAIARGTVTLPLTALTTLGGIVGLEAGGNPANCGEAAAAPAKGLLNGIGNGAKDAFDGLRSLLP
jgi:uncharacterized protein involved in outer membrane biogenesis